MSTVLLDAVVRVIDVLESGQVPYMIVGSFSTNLYGLPRSTKDADFVIELAGSNFGQLFQALGPSFVPDPQIRFETITGTTRQVVRLREAPFMIEFFLLSDDPHDRSRFGRRLRRDFGGRSGWVATAEDAVIMKLRWSKQGNRPKDVGDVKGILAVQRDALDWAYIYHWCDEHGTRGLLDQIRASIPPE